MKTRFMKQRILAMVLLLMMVFTSIQTFPTMTAYASKEQQETTFRGNGYQVTFCVTSQWDGAFNASVTIENTTEEVIDNWAISFYIPYEITNIWNGKVLSYKDGIYTIKNVESNQDIEVNKSVSFGFSANAIGALNLPSYYTMMSKKIHLDSTAFEASYETSGDWSSSFNGQININSTSDDTIEDWTIEFDFPYQIERFWTAQIVSKTGDHYVIKNAGYNANIKAGETLNLGFEGKPGDVSCDPTNLIMYHVKVDPSNLNLDSDQDSLSDYLEIKLETNIFLLGFFCGWRLRASLLYEQVVRCFCRTDCE